MPDQSQGNHGPSATDAEYQGSPETSGARANAAPSNLNGNAVGRAPILSAAEFQTELDDAEHLLRFAAAAGIDVSADVRRDVLAAKMTSNTGWTEPIANALLAALTALSERLKPVSGESLRKCVVDAEAAQTIAMLRRVSIGLGLFIVPFSIAAFVASATCDAIRKDIEVGNALVVTLARELTPPSETAQARAGADVRSHSESDRRDLQQLAATIRATQTRAKRLNDFGGFPYGKEKFSTYQLPVPILDFSATTADAIRTYQSTRYVAQGVQEAVLTTFGALTTCLLPVLYALLGTCARLLRVFEGQIKRRTFTGADRPTAHFLIAAIGGLVVGLFGNLGAEHGSGVLPPLALAFLVGYGANVFFTYLDRMLRTFGQTGHDASSDSQSQNSKPAMTGGASTRAT